MSIQRRHPDGTSSMLPPQGPGPVDTSSEVRLAIVEEGLLAEIHDLNERLDEARAERDAALAKIQRIEALSRELRQLGIVPVFESAVELADTIEAALTGPEDRNDGG